jgi:hypothetical protein
VMEDTPVTGILTEDGKVVGVDTADGVVECEYAPTLFLFFWKRRLRATLCLSATKPIAFVCARSPPKKVPYVGNGDQTQLFYGDGDVGGSHIGTCCLLQECGVGRWPVMLASRFRSGR